MGRPRKVRDEETVPEVPESPQESQSVPGQAVWKRPSGTTVSTSDDEETLNYCKSLGWDLI